LTFLADGKVDQEIIDRLRSDGHAVLAVAEMEPGIDDEAVLSLARERSPSSSPCRMPCAAR